MLRDTGSVPHTMSDDMLRGSSVVVLSQSSELPRRLVDQGVREVLAFGEPEEPEELVTGVTYWLEQGPLGKPFDWLVADIEPTEAVNYANAHHEYLRGLIIAGIREQAAAGMAYLGCEPVGRTMGMVAWKRVHPPFEAVSQAVANTPCQGCSGRRKRVAVTKRRVRRRVVRAPVDEVMATMPCRHRGQQIGTMFTGNGFVPVFGCEILETCWYDQCRRCDKREQ